jgi:L-malate glycosyltransferase
VTRAARAARGRRRPVLGFVGIHAGGRTDQPVSQSETLAELFVGAGYDVRTTSSLKWPPLRTLDQIVSILRWRRVDVLVVSVFSGDSFWIAELATRLGRLTGKRLVLFLHGGNLPVFGPQHRDWVERVLRRADLLVAPSAYLADTFRDWGLDVRIIANTLPIEQYEFVAREQARPALLWMRTFYDDYDPLMAVRVVERVAAVHPDVRVTMAGADQGLFAATVAEAGRRGVADRIDFPGYILPEAKATALAEHDIFLNTNVVDNMPVSVIEAAAAGLVPVATSVGGIPALLSDGHDSVLVAPHDDAAMADAVLALLDDPSRFAALSRRARALAEHSSWTAVQARWEQELSLLVPQPRGRRVAVSPGEVSVRDVVDADLGEVARLHGFAFEDSVLAELGQEAVRRNYLWQLHGPHDLTAVAATDGDEVLGFLFGGVFRGSTIGFVKAERWFLVGQVVRHPGVLLRRVGLSRVGLALRLLLRRGGAGAAERPDRVPESSFGVLAIAVDPAAQGRGVGGRLMDEATARARAQGFAAMHLTVHPSNAQALGFYRARGWVELPEPDGSWAGRMTLSLTGG